MMLGRLTNTFNLRDESTGNATSLVDPEHFRFLEIGTTTYVYGAGGDNSADDGISVFQLETDGTLTLVETFFDNQDTFIQNGLEVLELSETSVGNFLFAGSTSDRGISVFRIEPDGRLTNTFNLRDESAGNATSLVDPEHFRFLEIGTTTYVYGAGGDNSADDGISVFQLETDGTLTLVETFFDNQDTFIQNGLEVLELSETSVGNFLFAGSTSDRGISVFRIEPDGRLTNTFNLRDESAGNATSLVDPEHFRFLEIGTTTYVYGAGGDNSADDGISVFQLETDGTLTLVETFFDNQDTFIQNGLEVLELSETSVGNFLFAGSTSDRGISVFRIEPDGRLTNTFNLRDESTGNATSLVDPEHFRFLEIGTTTYVYGAGGDNSADDGISVFQLETDGTLTLVETFFDNQDTFIQNGLEVLELSETSVGNFLFAGSTSDRGISVFRIASLFSANDDAVTLPESGTYFAFQGNDSVVGSEGNDTLDAGPGNDTVNGRSGDDKLFGGLDDDVVDLGPGDDSADGGIGVDTLSFASMEAPGFNINGIQFGAIVDLAMQGAVQNTGQGNDVFTNFENIHGSDFSDELFGDLQDNTIKGGGGADTLDGSDGADTLDGGTGNDTASYENSALGVDICLDTGAASGGDADGDELISIENVTGSQQTDTITGDSGDNVLIGLDGNDQLNGRAGNDTLDGGLGNDRFFVDSVDDVVIEAAGEGTDLITTSVDFTLAENVENASSSGVGDIAITGNGLANFMSGNGGDNRLVGLAGADRLLGRDGDDTLEGGADNDILEGGTGADRFVMTANNGDDQIIGWEASTDILDFEALGLRFADLRLTSSGNEALITFDDPAGGTGSVRLIDIDPEVLEIGIVSDPGGIGSPGGINLLAGTSGSENLAGTAAGEDLIGLAGNDTLNGRAGDDTMLGGFGNDRYLLDDAGDIALELEFQGIDQVDTRFDLVLGANIERAAVRGGGAVDIMGNELDNFITGSELTNVLGGGDGRDRLIARGGNDTLDGGLDNDVLEGGTGEDVFVFGADSGIDLITDFVVGEDLIDVTALGIAFADMTIVDGPLGALVIFDLEPGSVDLVQLQGVSAADVRLASFIGAPNLPIIGTAGDDVLRGTVEDDELQGLGGADRLDGLGGADTLIGGPGDDRYFIDDAGDVVTELAGEGTDLVTTNIDFTLPDNVEDLNTQTANAVNLTGNGLANALTGNDAGNVLTGLDGDDNLQGKAGADTIDGGAGFDVLRGGADADVFVFAPGDGATGDQIIDFEVGVDTIDLSATGLGFGDLTIVDVGANANVTYGTDSITMFGTTAVQLTQDNFDFGP